MSTTMDLEESISLLPTLFAAVLLGPLAGLVVASASMLGDFRRPYLRSVVYMASRAGSLEGCTGLVALSVQDVASSELGAIVVATLAGAVTAQVLDIAFACFTVWLRGTTRPWDTARTDAAGRLLRSSSLCASRRASDDCISGAFTMDACAVLRSRARCSAPIRTASGTAPAHGGPLRSQSATRAREPLRSRRRWLQPSTLETSTRRVTPPQCCLLRRHRSSNGIDG